MIKEPSSKFIAIEVLKLKQFQFQNSKRKWQFIKTKTHLAKLNDKRFSYLN